MASLMDRYPGISDLEKRAKRRSPRFAWEYLASGTGDEASMRRNDRALREVVLRPQFLKGVLTPRIEVELFGQSFASPIGVAPVGMTGMIWPGSDLALAGMAARRRVPHVLSTVATTAPERVAPVAGEYGWFQLYPPKTTDVRDDLLDRVENAGYRVLVVTADVPAASRRERQRKARIRVPPTIGPPLIWQALRHPAWSVAVARHGMPTFETLEAYVDRSNLKRIAGFAGAAFGGTLSWPYLEEIRDRWKGPVVVKGLLDPADAEQAVKVGADAVVVSNHGGRQLEAAPAAIEALPAIVDRIGGTTPVLFDSGVRSGADVARAIALGADFVFAGRAFYYGICALGPRGADHALDILEEGLANVMHQTGSESLGQLRDRLP